MRALGEPAKPAQGPAQDRPRPPPRSVAQGTRAILHAVVVGDGDAGAWASVAVAPSAEAARWTSTSGTWTSAGAAAWGAGGPRLIVCEHIMFSPFPPRYRHPPRHPHRMARHRVEGRSGLAGLVGSRKRARCPSQRRRSHGRGRRLQGPQRERRCRRVADVAQPSWLVLGRLATVSAATLPQARTVSPRSIARHGAQQACAAPHNCAQRLPMVDRRYRCGRGCYGLCLVVFLPSALIS